jgi:hypothetical protein
MMVKGFPWFERIEVLDSDGALQDLLPALLLALFKEGYSLVIF